MGFDKTEIEMHINNAGASLNAVGDRWIINGFMSAVRAVTLCEKWQEETTSKDKQVWLRQQIKDLYVMIDRYIERLQPHNGRTRNMYSDDLKLEAVQKAAKYPKGTPNRMRLLEEVGDQCGVPVTTLLSWIKELGE